MSTKANVKKICRSSIANIIGEQRVRNIAYYLRSMKECCVDKEHTVAVLKNIFVKEPSSMPPHMINAYSLLLDTIIARYGEAHVRTLSSILIDKDESIGGVYLRHDVDSNPEQLVKLCNEEIKRGLRSSIVIITADLQSVYSSYNAEDYADVFQKYSKEGFDFGLHTVAWAYQGRERWECLEKEVKLYEKIMGELPAYFVPHGFLNDEEHTMALRKEFTELAKEIMSRHPHFKGKMSDLYLKYRIGASDSGVKWPISEDQIPYYHKNDLVMVLTHPEYWI